MFKAKIVYIHDEQEKEVIAEIYTNKTIGIDEALHVAGVNLDDYAAKKGWESYDINAVHLEYEG